MKLESYGCWKESAWNCVEWNNESTHLYNDIYADLSQKSLLVKNFGSKNYDKLIDLQLFKHPVEKYFVWALF